MLEYFIYQVSEFMSNTIQLKILAKMMFSPVIAPDKMRAYNSSF